MFSTCCPLSLSLRSSLFFNLHWHCINIWTSCQAGERQQLLRLQLLLLLLLRWFMQWRAEKGIRAHLMLILRLFALSRRGVDVGGQAKGQHGVHIVCANAFSTIACHNSLIPQRLTWLMCVCVWASEWAIVCVWVCVLTLDNPINMHTKTQLDTRSRSN